MYADVEGCQRDARFPLPLAGEGARAKRGRVRASSRSLDEKALTRLAPKRVEDARKRAYGARHPLPRAGEGEGKDPVDLGRRWRALRREFPRFIVLGGCCGTDHR